MTPKRKFPIATGATSMYSPHVQPDLNLEVKFSRRNNLPEIVAGRQPHDGGRRQHVARQPRKQAHVQPCAAAKHHAKQCPAMAHPASIKRPASAKQFARVAANHRATSCAAAGHGQSFDGATGSAIHSHSSATMRATIARGSNNKLAAKRGRRTRSRALMRAEGRGRRTRRRPVAKKFLFQSEIQDLDAIQATIVLKDPSLSSDTTVGKRWRIRIPSPGGGGRLRLIKSTTGIKVPSSACTRRPDEISTDGNSSKSWPEQIPARGGGGGDGGGRRRRYEGEEGAAVLRARDTASRGPTTIVAPKSQFRTCPTDHGKASSNIAP
ncbi:hypothetical protein F511_27365 [Dorcoceras hygrometricum]|uniref:Uncharacterized protein n=1 Tax=Dorcoceras hygrometricum TaxID=472368 RepID=A0A2Z7DEP0_9LAMI|nr:hypothetical protein F511_27365 [Dorcoceras hygrometricum]